MTRKAGAPRGTPKLSSIDLNLLLALDALLRDANVTRAGRRVGLSQPAMSHALGRLRDVLGDSLLVREGRVMRLTAFAERMAPRVRDLMGDIEATLLAHKSFDPASSVRTFRIATNDYCGAVFMPEFLARLRRAAPFVTLDLHAHSGPAPVQELARGELDLAVGIFLDSNASLERRVLYDERFVCLVRKSHPRVRGALSLQRFLELDHVLVAAPDYGLGVVDFALAERGLRRRVVARVPHFLVAPRLLAESDLIATLPDRLARLAASTGDLRILAPPLELPAFAVQMAWHASVADDAAGNWLRSELAEAVKPWVRER